MRNILYILGSLDRSLLTRTSHPYGYSPQNPNHHPTLRLNKALLRKKKKKDMVESKHHRIRVVSVDSL